MMISQDNTLVSGDITGAPKRKPMRLPEYDYGSNGCYFVTICTQNRRCVLSRVVGDDAHIVPTKYGEVAEKYIKSIPGIDKYVIMPNHIHMIIINDSGTMWASSPTISQKIKSFKTLVTKEIGTAIFQRSFHDHVIRDSGDYLAIWEYIDTNPAKWADDEYNCQYAHPKTNTAAQIG